MKISHNSDSEDIRIYIDDVLHIRIPRDKNMKLQSWIEGHAKLFIIEIWCKKHLYRMEYDNRKTWERILKTLDNIL